MPRQLITRSLLNSLGVVVYVFGVAAIMQNGNAWFGQKDTFLTGVAVLLLFCVSAAVVGGLVLGYPLTLFLGGQKREAINTAIMTVGWLAGEMILVFLAMAILRSV